MSDTKGVNPKDLLGILKPPLSLVPAAATIWEAMAMKFGAYGIDAEGKQARPKGYGPFNWRENPVRASIYVDAIERHLARVKDGGAATKATDSLVYDLAHIRACCGIVIDALETGNLIDDIPSKGGPAGRLIDQLTVAKPTTTPEAPNAEPQQAVAPHTPRTSGPSESDPCAPQGFKLLRSYYTLSDLERDFGKPYSAQLADDYKLFDHYQGANYFGRVLNRDGVVELDELTKARAKKPRGRKPRRRQARKQK